MVQVVSKIEPDQASSETLSISQEIRKESTCTEFYSKAFSRRISPYLSEQCVKFGISANAVTYLMLLSGLAGAAFMLPQSFYINMLGCLLLVFTNILDTCDGEVARYTGTSSRMGVFLDKIIHFVVDSVLGFALGWHFYVLTGWMGMIVVGFCVSFFLGLDMLSKEVFVGLTRDEEKSGKKLKLNLSYNSQSFSQFVVHITSSNVAFYHLYPIALGLDLVMTLAGVTGDGPSYIFSAVYFIYFVAMAVVRALVRLKKIGSKI